jgi:hypothetical protein
MEILLILTRSAYSPNCFLTLFHLHFCNVPFLISLDLKDVSENARHEQIQKLEVFFIFNVFHV